MTAGDQKPAHEALRLVQVEKHFFHGTPDEVTALDRVDLTLTRGEFVTVVGSNGAGKSTLLGVISGTEVVDRGRVEIDGRDVTRQPAYERARYVGRVSQDPRAGTAANLSVEQNMALALLRGQPRGLGRGVTPERRYQFRWTLAPLGLGLEHRLGTAAGVLSGGQRQALALMLATLVTPTLLLLDEHTAALDPRTAPTVLEITRRVVEDHHITTLMVTHNVEHAIQYGTRLIMMHDGRVVLDIAGDEKRALSVSDLVAQFEEHAHAHLVDDRMLLSQE